MSLQILNDLSLYFIILIFLTSVFATLDIVLTTLSLETYIEVFYYICHSSIHNVAHMLKSAMYMHTTYEEQISDHNLYIDVQLISFLTEHKITLKSRVTKDTPDSLSTHKTKH